MNGIDWCAQAIKGPTPEYVKGQPYLGWANRYGDRDAIDEAFGLVNAIDPTRPAIKGPTPEYVKGHPYQRAARMAI